MALEVDRVADVVEQRGVLEPLALALAEAVDGRGEVEQPDRQAGDLLGVVEHRSARAGRAPRPGAGARRRRSRSADPGGRAPRAPAPRAARGRRGGCGRRRRGARAPRAAPRRRGSSAARSGPTGGSAAISRRDIARRRVTSSLELAQAELAQAAGGRVRRRDGRSGRRGRRSSRRCRRSRRRARRAPGAVTRRERRAHRAPQPLDLGRRGRDRRRAIAARRSEPSFRLRTEREPAAARDAPLGRAAADVDHHRGAAAEVDRVAHGAEDQLALLDAGEPADVDVGERLDLGEELVAVGGLAHRAGRHREHPARALEPRERAHLEQRLEPAAHRARRERAAPERALAQPHHVALARQHPVAAGAVALDHDHVDRVRADVDRGEPLGRRDRGGPAAAVGRFHGAGHGSRIGTPSSARGQATML